MPQRRALLVTYPWPPMPTVGINRWTALARHLRPLGIELDVLTTAAFGRLPDDAARGVVRALDLSGSRLARRLLRRPPLPVGRAVENRHEPPPELLTTLLVPDVYALSWGPAAVAVALSRARRQRPDVLISTTPYESAHLVALAVARATSIPWIADFRDGWTFEPHRPPFRLAAQRRIDAAMERAVVRRADVTIAATLPIAQDLRDRLGVPAIHVPNAWDPDLEAQVDPAAAPAPDARKFSLVHTGILSGGWGRSPRPFFEGLRLAIAGAPEMRDRFELLLAGRIDAEEQALIAAPELEGVVRHVGMLSRGAALALQRSSDALLLITSRNAGEATGKLFEYLGAGRPILALAEGNEAARIVTATGTGVCAPPDDPVTIARALTELVTDRAARAFRPHDLEAYVQPGPARAVAELVERAIAR